MKKLAMVLILLAVAGAGGMWWWQQSRAQGEVAAPTYRLAEVTRGDIVQSVTASGELGVVTMVEVGSQVSGILQEVRADFNDVVKEGDLLAVIEPSTFQARVVQAEAELLNAQAALDLAEINARRAGELRQKELISQAEFDQAQAELKQRQATVSIRAASLTNAKVDLQRTEIRAPIDGIVISRNVEPGQTVQASFSAPKLFEIANDLRDMEIVADVSEADIGKVLEGQEVTFQVDAFPDETFRGKVLQVRNKPTMVQNVVTYGTIISVRNPDLKLKPGMTANVTIITSRREGVLKVANAALRFRPPEGAEVLPLAVADKPAGAAPAAAGGSGESGQRPDFASLPPEIRERMLQRFDKNGDGTLDEAEMAAAREARRAAQGAGGGGGFGGGGGGPGGGGFGGGGGENGAAGGSRRPRAAAEVNPNRTVYLLPGDAPEGSSGQGRLEAKNVLVGITDGAYTEVAGGLKEGDRVATGTVLVAEAPTQGMTNPFAPRFPGSRGGSSGGGRP